VEYRFPGHVSRFGVRSGGIRSMVLVVRLFLGGICQFPFLSFRQLHRPVPLRGKCPVAPLNLAEGRKGEERGCVRDLGHPVQSAHPLVQ
jgi:hypothetical protein